MSDPPEAFTEPSVWPAPPAAALGLVVTLADGSSTHPATRAVTLGRSERCDLRLADPTVSAFHAELAPLADGVHVADMKSRNGTWYAGARIRDAVVPSGATIQLGATPLRVDLAPCGAAPQPRAAAFGELAGESPVMQETFALLARLARSDLSVLLQGDTGTGKELAARGLHDHSLFAGGPFVVLDCTTIPPALAESVLFGHVKGAFTGAAEARPGHFEQADGGSIFLDEVGELPLELQPKLLRVLERREVVRVGATRPQPVRVRVVAATWRDLRVMVNQGAFREDLYYRLAQARVTLPPLAARREDVPGLVRRFLAGLDRASPAARAIMPDALDELARRDYPGNVRELRATVERAARLAAGSVITPADLAFERVLGGPRAAAPAAPAAPTSRGELGPFKAAKQSIVDEFERDYLARLLERTGGNLSRAAAYAGVERNHLRDLCRKHGLRSAE
ncbi:MAG: sigma 54-interacting transcriptional regulator [Polyangiales bacterium]